MFTHEYLEAKVKESQPHGNDFAKARRMYLLGSAFIIERSVANSVSTFNVESQRDSSIPPYKVKIEKVSKLSRDKLAQFDFSCTCPHFVHHKEVKLCKHIIYVLMCYYLRTWTGFRSCVKNCDAVTGILWYIHLFFVKYDNIWNKIFNVANVYVLLDVCHIIVPHCQYLSC